MEGACIRRYFCGIFAKLNPFCWSKRKIKVVFTAFFFIFLPIYLFVGFQPTLPADAANYPVLEIGSIGLTSPVAPLELEDHQLIAPATIAGAYSRNPNKTLIIGHSSTVFKKLSETKIGEEFSYNNESYRIVEIETQKKSDINMSEILAAVNQETIIIMTCAGDPLPDQDATHRLLVTATKL